MAVPTPNSHAHNQYLKDRLTVFITRCFKRKKSQGRLRIQQVSKVRIPDPYQRELRAAGQGPPMARAGALP